MNDGAEFGRVYADEQLRRSRHPLRRFVKGFYLNHVLRDVQGPTIDFGCGAGQILAKLPAGSVGVEINPVLVDALRRAGLNVVPYDASADDFTFSGFEPGRYHTLVLSHVLEHFEPGSEVIRKIWRAAARLGIGTILAVVPGAKGFASDPTHKTFVTVEYLRNEGLECCEGFELREVHYFPGNARFLGALYAYHELKLVFRRPSV